MLNNKYQSFNVLNTDLRKFEVNNTDTIAEIAAMINASGNRAKRRKLEKIVGRTEKIMSKCEQSATERAYKALDVRARDDFMYIFACIGLVLNEDYHWKEDPEQEHGQITSFFERLTKKMDKYYEQGLSTKEIIDLLDEKTGVCLVSKQE